MHTARLAVETAMEGTLDLDVARRLFDYLARHQMDRADD